MTSDEVPLMFQAQVEGRCQIQRVIPGEKHQQSHQWVAEWTEVLEETIPKHSSSKPLSNKPVLRNQGKNHSNVEKENDIKSKKVYVELLTIFPDDSKNTQTDNPTDTQKFLNFLSQESKFVKVWPLWPLGE